MIQRRRRKSICIIQSNDRVWTDDPIKIQQLFKDLYHQLYTFDVVVTPWRDTCIKFHSLDRYILEDLNDDLKEEDIKQALMSMAPRKSPGPDGFPVGFY